MVFRDITERKRAEEALRESEQKYRVLVANADEAIFIAQDEVVKFPNPKALEMTGYSTEELAGVPFTGLIHPEDRGKVLERYFDRLRGGTPPETYPFRIMDKAGEEIWVQLTADTGRLGRETGRPLFSQGHHEGEEPGSPVPAIPEDRGGRTAGGRHRP